MLSELNVLAMSLTRLGLASKSQHRWVKPLERGEFLRVELDSTGIVVRLETLPDEDAVRLSKISKDNFNSFPAIKVDSPLFELPDDDALRLDFEAGVPLTVAKLKEKLSGMELRAKPADLQRLAVRLHDFPSELRPIFERDERSVPALVRLLRTLGQRTLDPKRFLRELTCAAFDKLEQDPKNGLLHQLLIGLQSKKQKVAATESESKKITIVLDVAQEAGEGLLRIAHPAMTSHYNRILLQIEAPPPDGLCALSGNRQAIERGVFPQPKLPILGLAYLFSMNPAALCHRRYGRIGSSIFPAGQQSLATVNEAVAWITKPEREGKSWSRVPRNDGEQNDLLLAWFDRRPDLPADFAEFLASQSSAEITSDFETKIADLLGHFRAHDMLDPDSIFNTLVLRRISKGQVQVLLSRHYAAERLPSAVERWESGAANGPKFELLFPQKKGQAALRLRPQPPMPADVLDATKHQFIRRGDESQSVSGCELGVVFDLLFGDTPEASAAAQVLLRLLLVRSGPLLALCGEQIHRDRPMEFDVAKEARPHAVRAFAVLCIALYRLDHRKEAYMTEAPYLLGRMLALVDTLHASYCKVIRGGNLPPQLLGSQNYVAATRFPARAFANLGDRLRIYQAWARTTRIADSPKDESERENSRARISAKWALARLGEIAPQLHGRLPSGQLDDFGKAELLLGYLAREEKKNDEGTDPKQGEIVNEQRT
jgi:hypothetical protein